ncbi:MAG: SDR family oxidoreductase [Simkaniaceae bacterium]
MKRTDFQTVFITGASSGLGKALAVYFAGKAQKLILTARSQEKLQSLKQQLQKKISIECIAADLSSCKDRQQLAEAVAKEAPDLLINNAGLGLYGPALDHEIEEQLNILTVNAKALMHLTLAGAKALKDAQKKGTIVNIASVAGFFPFPYFASYSASKAFVINFSQAMDEELKDFGIRVLCACPGQIHTKFRSKAAKNTIQKTSPLAMSQDKAVQKILKQLALKKPISIFDAKYHLGLLFLRLIPRKIRSMLLKRSIQKRC